MFMGVACSLSCRAGLDAGFQHFAMRRIVSAYARTNSSKIEAFGESKEG
jgi:hypothetical protein